MKRGAPKGPSKVSEITLHLVGVTRCQDNTSALPSIDPTASSHWTGSSIAISNLHVIQLNAIKTGDGGHV